VRAVNQVTTPELLSSAPSGITWKMASSFLEIGKLGVFSTDTLVYFMDNNNKRKLSFFQVTIVCLLGKQL
jgi:hypothetical protein